LSRPGVRRPGGDRGSAALFVAVFAPAMLFLAGLVIDGGGALEARQRAADMAESAARAAGNQCDPVYLRSESECRITDATWGRAQAVARRYIEGDGVTSSMTRFRPVDGEAGQYYGVSVTVTIVVRTTLLGIVPAYKTITVGNTATAVSITGL
jgi:hypothetical protein